MKNVNPTKQISKLIMVALLTLTLALGNIGSIFAAEPFSEGPGISVSLVGDRSEALANTSVDFTITVENTGTVELIDIVVTAVWHERFINPDFTNTPFTVAITDNSAEFTIPSLSAGESMTFDYSLTIDNITSYVDLRQDVWASVAEHELSAEAYFDIDGLPEGSPQATITIDADVDVAKPGQTITYTVVAYNSGTVPIIQPIIIIPIISEYFTNPQVVNLPDNFTYQIVGPGFVATFDLGEAIRFYYNGVLPVGEQLTVQATAVVRPDFPFGVNVRMPVCILTDCGYLYAEDDQSTPIVEPDSNCECDEDSECETLDCEECECEDETTGNDDNNCECDEDSECETLDCEECECEDENTGNDDSNCECDENSECETLDCEECECEDENTGNDNNNNNNGSGNNNGGGNNDNNDDNNDSSDNDDSSNSNDNDDSGNNNAGGGGGSNNAGNNNENNEESTDTNEDNNVTETPDYSYNEEDEVTEDTVEDVITEVVEEPARPGLQELPSNVITTPGPELTETELPTASQPEALPTVETTETLPGFGQQTGQDTPGNNVQPNVEQPRVNPQTGDNTGAINTNALISFIAMALAGLGFAAIKFKKQK